MNTAEWILVIFLSVALLAFLICGIILAIKLMHLTDEARQVVIKGQGLAEKADGVMDKADDIVGNVKDLTSVGGLVKPL